MLQSLYSAAAALVVIAHLAFVVFCVGGAALLWRWPRLVWLHVPVVLWGITVEFCGLWCPLTPLENHLRRLGGSQGYANDFVAHYLLPLIYPAHLTREIQIELGLGVAIVNAGLYAAWLRARRRRR
jgi:Protein of Unknown function (DUF2784)